jgi:hypothetical protein
MKPSTQMAVIDVGRSAVSVISFMACVSFFVEI